MKTVVSAKGRVTIPKLLRDRLGIRPGEVLDFAEERGRLVAIKVNAPDKVDAAYGIVDLGASTDTLIELLRGHDRSDVRSRRARPARAKRPR